VGAQKPVLHGMAIDTLSVMQQLLNVTNPPLTVIIGLVSAICGHHALVSPSDVQDVDMAQYVTTRLLLLSMGL